MRLLFIEPKNLPTEEPVIDDLTLRMIGALRKATQPDYAYCGLHNCVCGALSDSTDRILVNGWITNTLCVHYLAYHRAEVPASDLDAVSELPLDMEGPSSNELHGPEVRYLNGTKFIRPIDGPRERYDRPT
jgi:hypothetical protein